MGKVVTKEWRKVRTAEPAEIIQVSDSIAWVHSRVHCASGNVFLFFRALPPELPSQSNNNSFNGENERTLIILPHPHLGQCVASG